MLDMSNDERRKGYDQAVLEGIRARLTEIQTEQKETNRKLDELKTSANGSALAIQSLQLQGQDRETRLRRLEDSDRRWAALAIIVSTVISAIIQVVWP